MKQQIPLILGLLISLIGIVHSSPGWQLLETEEGPPSPTGGDYSMLDELLKDTELIKGFIPKTADELFDLLEKIVPGFKEMQKPIIDTLNTFWPVMKKGPDVLIKLVPTLKEMINAVEGGKDIPDDDFAKWGKSLMKTGGELAKESIGALKSSPFGELKDKFKALGLAEKLSKLMPAEWKTQIGEGVEFVTKYLEFTAELAKAEEEARRRHRRV